MLFVLRSNFYFLIPQSINIAHDRVHFLSLHFLLQAAICRCSQPLSGLNSRCMEDEQMLQAICQANPNCPFIYVVDTRPKV